MNTHNYDQCTCCGRSNFSDEPLIFVNYFFKLKEKKTIKMLNIANNLKIKTTALLCER